MRKKVRCGFCGTVLTNEKCYVARGKKLEGLAAAMSSSEEPTLYDAVDCPKCGKQEIVGVRERLYAMPKSKILRILRKEEEDAGDNNNSDNMCNLGDDLMDQ
jgi:uncharacterized protein (DUF2225 family)